MKALGIFAWIAISSLGTALIQAAVLGKLWAWFVAHEYGAGPSLGAWFGIATILGLIVGMHQHTPDDSKKRDADEQFTRSVRLTIAKWIGCGLVLVVAWCVGSVVGWVR